MENIKLNFLHVCDYASLSEGGKLNVLGIFENVFSDRENVVYPRLFIVSNVSFYKPGSYKQVIKIVDKRKNIDIIKPLEFPITINFDSKKENESKFGVLGQVDGIRFDGYGDYLVEVFVDDEKKGETKINFSSKL
jgi:hypothetical protein